MNRIVIFLAVLSLIPAFAAGQSLFQLRKPKMSIQDFHKIVESNRMRLFAGDEDEREEQMELFTNALENPPQSGDAIFVTLALQDFVLGIGRPAGAAVDEELQEVAVTSLVELAEDDESPVANREAAIIALARIVAGDGIGEDASSDAVAALVDHSDGGQAVLAKIAITGLGAVAVRTGGDWEESSEAAAEALARRFSGDDVDLGRFAFMQSAKALMAATQATDATEILLESIADDLEDLPGPRLQLEVAAALQNIVKSRDSGEFEDQMEDLRDALDDLDPDYDKVSDNLRNVLRRLTGETDLEDVDNLLRRLEAIAPKSRSPLGPTIDRLGRIAADRDVTPMKLRKLTDAQIRLTQSSPAVMTYYRTAMSLLDSMVAHGRQPIAAIPVTQLARLLASTGDPGMQIPVIDHVAWMVGSNIPVWLRMRLVGVIFLQAGDAVDPAVRRHAFDTLDRIGKTHRTWSVRKAVLIRMTQLGEFARDEKIKQLAANWK